MSDQPLDRIEQMFLDMNQRFDQMDQRFDKLEANVLEGFEQITGLVSQISDIMRSFLYKQKLEDIALQEIKEKVDKLTGE